MEERTEYAWAQTMEAGPWGPGSETRQTAYGEGPISRGVGGGGSLKGNIKSTPNASPPHPLHPQPSSRNPRISLRATHTDDDRHTDKEAGSEVTGRKVDRQID